MSKKSPASFDDFGTIRNFSQSNPTGRGQGDVMADNGQRTGKPISRN